MSLSKYIAQAGICARRKATELIKAGQIKVNGRVVTEPGHKIEASDSVVVAGKLIKPERKVYFLLNKPRDYITTVSDERGRKNVLDLFRGVIKERVYPVGRLDRDTTGLLLLTNDGMLAQKLAHPRHQVQKVYHVALDKPLTALDYAKIKQGVRLPDGVVRVDAMRYVPRSGKKQLLVVLHSGKYRVVRRLFQALDYTVIRLERVQYADLTKKDLRLGQWRMLSKQEIQQLSSLS